MRVIGPFSNFHSQLVAGAKKTRAERRHVSAPKNIIVRRNEV